MPTKSILAIELDRGFLVRVLLETPEGASGTVDSHSCYHAYPETTNAYSYCTFTIRFDEQSVPEPMAGLAPLVILLALLGRKRCRMR